MDEAEIRALAMRAFNAEMDARELREQLAEREETIKGLHDSIAFEQRVRLADSAAWYEDCEWLKNQVKTERARAERAEKQLKETKQCEA